MKCLSLKQQESQKNKRPTFSFPRLMNTRRRRTCNNNFCDSDFQNFTARVNYLPVLTTANYNHQYFNHGVVEGVGY